MSAAHRLSTIVWVIVLCFGIASPAGAGELFDDYLNYLRPGPGTPPGDSAITVKSNGVGQSFTVDDSIGEIYRIGVRPVYDTWDKGESVTLSLLDKPQSRKPVASYTIPFGTHRIQKIHDTDDRVLYFQLRAKTEGRNELYFELTSSGGDGVDFEAFSGDMYREGELAGATKAADLSFLVDIKPVPDREANLRSFFTERLDIDRPELAKVKRAVSAEDWERAIQELADHFHNRFDLWDGWESVMEVDINPDANTELADKVLAGYLEHRETEEYVPWRHESYWVPEYPTERRQSKHAVDPPLYWWHIDRELTGAYSATGDPKYARGAIDLRMQFILDNPNPKYSKLPWYFEIWNDRTAAARAPGHGTLPYARLYNFEGWTPDEKLIYVTFFEDNAYWTFQATSRANWGAEAAKSCYEFGLRFPEWSRSKDYVGWGTERLAEIVLRDVRGDGTSSEAAIKYHAMVARRLKSLLATQADDERVDINPDLLERLTEAVEEMYEHMAYTLMPNSYVVMGGDSWYENYAYSRHLDAEDDILDPQVLLTRLHRGSDKVSAYLASRLPAEAADAIRTYEPETEPDEETLEKVVGGLNDLISPEWEFETDEDDRAAHRAEQAEKEAEAWLYEPGAFADVELRDTTQVLLEQRPWGAERELLHRLLIEDAYPDLIRKGYKDSELTDAGRLVDRDDFVWIASQGLEGEPPERTSIVYPEGGYFIMRSHFGEGDKVYRDALHMFIHNEMFFGNHGHRDFTAINLYGYGRPLIIDPGQYAVEPPEGINKYWDSITHSMLVADGRSHSRDRGPSEWVTNDVIDYYDGVHYGYRKLGDIDGTRRRIAFMRPNYFLVDDAADTTGTREWAQVWHLIDPEASYSDNGGLIETTFDAGGNVMILNKRPQRFEVEVQPGITSTQETYPDTRIIRLKEKTSDPRYQSLIYPYRAGEKPGIEWEIGGPDGKPSDGRQYMVIVQTDEDHDWAVFGQEGEQLRFGRGKHRVDASFATVRFGDSGGMTGYAWALGKYLEYDGQIIAESDAMVHTLGAHLEGDTLVVESREPDPTLALRTLGAKRFTVNGRTISNPEVADGMFYPFADEPKAIVADDRTAFHRATETDEWEREAGWESYNVGYTHHETDVGRHESGFFLFEVPKTGTYRVEAHIPAVPKWASSRVEYRVFAKGEPVSASNSEAILDVKETTVGVTLTLNQQTEADWVNLGEYEIDRGSFKVQVRNVTEIDGQYLIADAVRLVPVD